MDIKWPNSGTPTWAIAKWNWTEVCGEKGFFIWDANKKDLGLCFSIIGIQLPLLTIFSAVSAYYFGKPTGRIVRTTSQLCTIWLRCLIVLFMALLPIVQICLLTIQSNKLGGFIDYVIYLQAGTKAITWFVHLGMCLVLRSRLTLNTRGPSLCNFLWFQTFSTDIMIFRTCLINRDPSNLLSNIDYIASLSTVVLQVFYLATLLSGMWNSDGVSNEQQRNQLNTSISGHSYSQFQEDMDPFYLGVAKEGSSFLSRLFFHWVTPLMDKGVAAKLTGTDELFDLPPSLSTRQLSKKFVQVLGSYPAGEKKSTLLRALHRCYGLQFYSIGVLKFLADLAGFASPMLLNGLINFIEDKNEHIEQGLLYAGGLFLATTIAAFCNAHFNYLMSVVGLRIRSSLITTVYNKILKPSLSNLSELNMGSITNYMSTDTDRIVNSCSSFHAFWSIPVQIAVTLYLLYLQVDLAFLAGLGFCIILIPVNKCLASKIGELSEKLMASKDERVKCVTEAVTGIRVLKYHVWEDHFIQKIKKLRGWELKYLKGRKYLDALCVYFWATTPVLISILTFTTYTLMGNKLTAAKVFTTIALLNMLIAPLNTFPWALNGLTEAWVSLKRIQKLIFVPDVDILKFYSQGQDRENSQTDVCVKNGHFEWGHNREDRDDEATTPLMHNKFCLDGIDLDIQQGKLVCIIGPVGSGKSSILNALLSEMEKKTGSVYLSNLLDGFGYVAQQPWLQRGSIRENILFGETYQQLLYNDVLRACCLEDDLYQLRGGDSASVGESGSTLSGGQKARIALARAAYQDKSVYLLDDILSAVDPGVARNIFNNCIMGLLRYKTRILCTHNRTFLQKADWIVVLDNGTIKNQGPPQDVLKLYSDILDDQDDSSSSATEQKISKINTESLPTPNADVEFPEVSKDEESDSGNIEFSVIKDYWHALGHVVAVFILLSLLLMQASRNLSDWWLTYWVTHVSHNSTSVVVYASQSLLLDQEYTLKAFKVEEATFYLSIYGMIAGLNSVFTLFRAFLFAYGGVRAAASLHSKLLKSVLRGKVHFFDVTPAGRLINRFSSDTYTIDDSLPFILNILLAQLFGLIGSLIVTTYGLPWLCLVLVPLVPLYRWLQHYYRLTSRELKRIGSVALSPVYNHFNETLQGLTTIKALGASKRFSQENETHLENSQKAQFSGMAAGQWLGLRLQFFGVVIVGSVGVLAVVQHHYGYGVNAGLVGLSITYALSMTSMLNGVINAFTETEKEMIAVERTKQYITQIEPEPLSDTMPLLSFPWPGQGVVTFNSVEFRHRDNVPLSLNGVTFQTHPAEKVGIVGRTGAGKSSIFASLFRLNEVAAGQIMIDAVDIASVGLRSLRSRLAIIPQEPFLFSGTLRENIDPLNEYSTPEIWTAVRKCHLEEVAFRLGSIDFSIGDHGQFLSVGQKQLVCLARAVLHNAKILCIDEATANVDNETDQQIQKIIKESFYYSTVLTIAHRVNSVLDCDRVLVMKDGAVVEFESPDVLLQDPNTHFSRLIND